MPSLLKAEGLYAELFLKSRLLRITYSLTDLTCNDMQYKIMTAAKNKNSSNEPEVIKFQREVYLCYRFLDC